MSSTSSRLALEALTAFVAGTAIAGGIYTWLVFADASVMAAVLAVVVGGSLLVALAFEATDPQTGGLASMIAGFITLLFGVVELALVGITYSWQTYTQPAWIQEFFYIVAGIVIAALGLRAWRPREVATPTSRAHPA